MADSGHDKPAALSLNIGNKIRRLRQSRGVSLNDLSKLSGVSKGALSKLGQDPPAPVSIRWTLSPQHYVYRLAIY